MNCAKLLLNTLNIQALAINLPMQPAIKEYVGEFTVTELMKFLQICKKSCLMEKIRDYETLALAIVETGIFKINQHQTFKIQI